MDNFVSNYPSQLLTSDIKDSYGIYPVYDASGKVFKYIDRYQQRQDTVSIIKYGSGCGRTFMSKGFHSILGTMTDILPNDETDVIFIYAFTLSQYFKSIVKKYTEIGTTPNLYYSDYSKAKISNYAISNKKLISNIVNKMEQKEKLLNTQLVKLNKLKGSLLNRLFI